MNVRRRVPEMVQAFPPVPELQGDVFMVFAHPDDELGVAGYVSTLRHCRVHWIVVSDASSGFISPFYRKGRSKTAIRMAEADACAAALGIAPPLRMNLPDGRLETIADLGDRIEKAMPCKPAAIFTHDICGLYGHGDHLAVHDAVRRQFAGRNVPVLMQALPAWFQRWLPLRRAAHGRTRSAITHAFDMDPATQATKARATRAHRSQRHVFVAMMQARPPEHFFRLFCREFYTVDTL